MKIGPVRAELFHADRQKYEGTDRRDHVTKLIFAFRNFWKHETKSKYRNIWRFEGENSKLYSQRIKTNLLHNTPVICSFLGNSPASEF